MIRPILVDSEWKLKNFLKKVKNDILSVFPDTESKINRMRLEFFSDTLFGEHTILLKSVEKWEKEDKNWLLKNAPLSKHDVIITSNDLDLLKKFGDVEDLSCPKQWDLKGWIEEINDICEVFGVKMDETEKELILNRTGMKIDLMAMEIEKISVVSKNPSLEEVKMFVPIYSTPAIFDFYRLFFEKDSSALDMLKDLLEDVHPLIPLRGLEKTSILVGQMLSNEKSDYSWDDVKNISKALSVPTPQIADLVGFSLGGKKRKNVLKLWKYEEINLLMEDFQDVEMKIKNGADPVFTTLELTFKWTKGRDMR